jgi:phasin
MENMSKTASKMADTIEFPAFNATQATDQFRAFAEKGVEQSKEAYAKFKVGAEEAQKMIETTYESARNVAGEMSRKSLAAMRTNTEAGFSHLEQLAAARSLSDMIELQTSFMRKTFETMVEQAKDFQTASSKAMEEVAMPARSAFEKAVKELKIA